MSYKAVGLSPLEDPTLTQAHLWVFLLHLQPGSHDMREWVAPGLWLFYSLSSHSCCLSFNTVWKGMNQPGPDANSRIQFLTWALGMQE